MLERSHLPAVYLFLSRLFVLTKQLRISDEDNRPYKIIEDNHVVIIRNGEKYDVTGKTLAAFIGDDCCGIAKFNDEHLGSVSAPYTPAWKAAN